VGLLGRIAPLSVEQPERALEKDAVSQKDFQQRLLRWYDCNRRDLPWRKHRDPYCVWISEIMLQQTRVGAVLPHYEKFLEHFPTVHQLAGARRARVLAAWSGLGYYRRARMLHAAARTLVKEHSGKFPETAAELQKLSGIGPYTAAAIASIAFGQAVAVVDGNVARVLSRMDGKMVAGKDLWQAAQRLVSRERPGDFNQAMMELGATVCLPGAPRCGQCPLAALCTTKGRLHDPVKNIRQHRRDICYQLASSNGATFLVQRPRNATLMPEMWELPQCTHTRKKSWLTLRHSITVTDYTVRVVKSCQTNGVSGRWVQESRIATLPLTGLARKILRAAKLI
jgi:A/G-specific adenine glycosylase